MLLVFFFFSLIVNIGCKVCCQPAINPCQVCWTDSLCVWTLKFWFYCKENNTEMSTENVKEPEELWFLAGISLLIIWIFVLIWFLLFQIILFPYSPHGFITWQVLFTDQPLSLSKEEGQGFSVIFEVSWPPHCKHNLKEWDKICTFSPMSALPQSWLSSGTKTKPVSNCLHNQDSGSQMLLGSWQPLSSKIYPFYIMLNI